MAKTEDIEAKLAAYVDGELDGAGHHQIEQHLIDHPNHRQLIQELTQQRELLRGLPRQSAPPEVAESFNSQLERAVLLGDVDGGDGGSPAYRIGYFSNIRAIAAMLLLTGGLAGLIWYLLPTEAHLPQLADIRVSPATLPGIERNTTPEFDPTAEAVARIREELADDRPPVTTPAASPEETRAMIALADSIGRGRGARGGGGIAIPGADDIEARLARRSEIGSNARPPSERIIGEMIRNDLPLGPPAPASSSFTLVFSTDNLDVANQQVTNYLTSNGIAWQNESEPMPQPLDLRQQQTGLSSRMIEQSVQLKSGPTTASQVAQDQLQQSRQAQLSNRIIAKQLPRSQADQVISELNVMQSQQRQYKAEPLSLRVNNSAQAPLASEKAAVEADSAQQREKQQLYSPAAASGPQDAFGSLTPPAMARDNSPATLPFAGEALARDRLVAPELKIEATVFPGTQPAGEDMRKGTVVLAASPAAPGVSELVDVVIVVTPEMASEPAPATQPATAPTP